MSGHPEQALSAANLRERPGRPAVPVGFVLFVCMFAGQAAVIALSPVLPDVAVDLGVTTATAGQLRAVSGLVAAVTALSIGPLTRKVGLRDLLLGGLIVLALGCLLSAAAPSFAVLALAQAPVGAGLAVVIAASTAAAAEWARERELAATLSWTLIGPPVSWIVGMPVIGLCGAVSWRLGWLVVPLAAAVAGAAMVTRRLPDAPLPPRADGERGALSDPVIAGWALGELLALSAWAGTVVFAGALLVESYGIGSGEAGLLLGAGAIAYLPGNFAARRWAHLAGRGPLAALALALAACVAAFGLVRPSLGVSSAIFAVLALLAGGRTYMGSAAGLAIAPDRRLHAMRLRAAALQLGYLVGSATGGVALATAGYEAVGWAFAALFVLAAISQTVVRPSRREGV